MEKQSKSIWQEAGPQNDVALSSRIRIARNFKDIPFPNNISPIQAGDVKSRIRKLFGENKKLGLSYYELSNISEMKRISWVEQHYMSIDITKTPEISSLLLNADGSVAIMINEEDHIRAQILKSGFDLDSCIRQIEEIDEILTSSNLIAYDENLGYLTSCPTNLGEGVRASVMLMIPALVTTGQLKGIIVNANKLNIVVRGFYGEGQSGINSIVQLSNKGSMGYSANDVVETIKNVVQSIMDSERAARDVLYANRKSEIEDRLMRSYGILKYARKMSQKEFYALIGNVWLAKYFDLIKDIDYQEMIYLIINSQDASLRTLNGGEENKLPINHIRADFIRERL